jgi:mannosylglycoprotein endo-beta-mannosidase
MNPYHILLQKLNFHINLFIVCILTFNVAAVNSQQVVELNKNWICKQYKLVDEKGETISSAAFPLNGWMSATVPGTVLTTLLNNKLIPDPFYGMNNNLIADIWKTGRDYYTYWFVTEFEETLSDNEQLWLNLRGVNYSCEVYLNGKKLNEKTHQGMFLRQSYNISDVLVKKGKNRLAVVVFPPDPVGNPNGGQGGDGTIARNVSHQYVAGWDWIQPVRDRNTGIWDKVTLHKTGAVKLMNPQVVTKVPGIRFPGKSQNPALIYTSAELFNASGKTIKGTLVFKINGQEVRVNVVIPSGKILKTNLPAVTVNNPKLWWPNGYGEPYLYPSSFEFLADNKTSDSERLNIGIREIKTSWNSITGSLQTSVNGQKIFIKGGNWIISDAMLRLSQERYDAEIRFHRDMNLNLIRVWGGALLERPEFFDACDKYGMLVFQDFWGSGDCNGKWTDPMKMDNQWTRRAYPDDHTLFIKSFTDQVKMVRTHPSLAFWCGGNEITPPQDILTAMQDSFRSGLDTSRYFFPYSNSAEMSFNSTGGNSDGPYTIQPLNYFWETSSYPYNSELGSVGTGDYESLKRFIPEQNLVVPDYINNKVDSVWQYHKDIGYENYIDKYGKASDIVDFGEKAQLVNYDQYRALIEGYSNHIWDWYTGIIIWKTQNPWTALRGQMYDYYLDPNACLYALKNAGEPVHVMCNQADGMVSIVNNTFETQRDLMLEVSVFNIKGEERKITQVFVEVCPSLNQRYFSVKEITSKLQTEGGFFLMAKILNFNKEVVSENLYWYPDDKGNYTWLKNLPEAKINAQANLKDNGKIEVKMKNTSACLAFFNRLSLVDKSTRERLLPVFYSNNYINLLPGEEKTIILDSNKKDLSQNAWVSVSGWNVNAFYIDIK